MRFFVKSHFAMSHYLVIAVIILAVQGETNRNSEEKSRSNNSNNVVNVELYYESLCYDSIQFVKNQLVPTYRALKDFISIKFIPYGKASHQRKTDENGLQKWHFTCQHGAAECYGNKAQACAINDILTDPERLQKQQNQVSLVSCVMSARNPSTAVPQCLETIGVNADHISLINNCIDNTKGDDLLAAYGEKTFSVQPNINFVPTIVLNGVFTHENQRNSLVNFKRTICNYIPEENKPTTCN